MSGGIPWITLPAGYLGSSLIGACLIACGFDTNASKVATLVLAGFFLITLWSVYNIFASIGSKFNENSRWARRSLLYVEIRDFF